MTANLDSNEPHKFERCIDCIHFYDVHCKCGRSEGGKIHAVGVCN